MSLLYQCPYEKACKCSLSDPCLTCETFSEYLNKRECVKLSFDMKDARIAEEFSKTY